MKDCEQIFGGGVLSSREVSTVRYGKRYRKAEVEITFFDSDDVIRTSLNRDSGEPDPFDVSEVR